MESSLVDDIDDDDAFRLGECVCDENMVDGTVDERKSYIVKLMDRVMIVDLMNGSKVVVDG